jgi:predicted SnoaL-like aldol condensation-catalyzing enzyme
VCVYRNSSTSKATSLLVILPLLVSTLLLAFINNSIAVYGQNISSNNTSQNQNQTQNNVASITTDNTQDKSEKEIRNEKIVREFYNNIFFAKNASAAVNYLEEDYIQHNPNIPIGREAFINVFTQIFKQNPNFSTQIKRIYTDGDYVIVHSFSPMGNTGNAVVDIYRVNDNGKSAEHWDVIQQIPSESANNNTMFYLRQK